VIYLVGKKQRDRDCQGLHEVLNQEYMAFINITPCENTTV